MVWTAFQIDYYDPEKKIWETCVNYYMGDLSEIDVNTDWRTHDVPNKRKNAKMLGVKDYELLNNKIC